MRGQMELQNVKDKILTTYKQKIKYFLKNGKKKISKIKIKTRWTNMQGKGDTQLCDFHS